MTKEAALLACHKLRKYIEAEGFKGFDPYDALNSPILSLLSCGNKYLRIAFIQILKRLPVNLRPLLLIRKDYNPKGLGLFLWGYAKLYGIAKRENETKGAHWIERAGHNKKNVTVSQIGFEDVTVQIDRLLDLLEGLKSRDCSGNAWGYNFDWQSRAFFVPKGTPTVVNSAFIGHALLDTWAITGNRRALEMALPIADFILQDLNRHEEEDGTFCFSYTPVDRYFVHNANLLGASLLIRLSKIMQSLKSTQSITSLSPTPESTLPNLSMSLPPHSSMSFPRERESSISAKLPLLDEVECREAALAALAWSMRYQRKDGSWFYAEKESAHWIDSFHTGFNLQAIRYFMDAGFGEEWREGYERGVQFYRNNFFLEDGTPKYYHDRPWPIDIHSPAQAVVFFSGMGKKDRPLMDQILNWMLANMQDESGYFYFQKYPHYTNSISYMRWGQAWAFHALTEYLSHEF